jgi:D-lactate dehydrogenase
VIAQSFADAAATERYARLIDDVVELVVRRYDGALKAEHGTGRNMAPFVEAEWGAEAYAVMRRLKALCDPRGLLNPGVILNDDRRIHLKNLKPMPEVEEEVDRCIECGYCEPRCPSADLTLTPRQRIVVRREQARLRADGGSARAAALRRAFAYDGLDTCAVDGLCATACPVAIDTGDLVKRLRADSHSAAARGLARSFARHYGWAERGGRAALRLGHLGAAVLGHGGVRALTRAMAAVLGAPFWQWSPEMPRPARPLPETPRAGAAAVYFPACITRVFGRLPGEPERPTLAEALVAVAARAGRPVWIPEDASGVCCGVPFSSKGFADAQRLAVNRAIERFWAWSEAGRLPIVIDTSPCVLGLLHARGALTLENQRRFDALRMVDAAAHAHDALLPGLSVSRRSRPVALHPVCSAQKMGIAGRLEALARACAESASVPFHAGCCGFAGDRGFLLPELTASATAREADELRERALDGCYSTSRTCEIGLTRATGRPWRSLIHLLEETTRPPA